MLAQKQPSFKECVIAHWSSDSAPKIQRGSSLVPKLRIVFGLRARCNGRGAFRQQRRSTVRTAGADGSANAGMSSEMRARNAHAVCLRFPEEG
jgi:hypothetical protein